ncbi:MAG: amidase family protein, partial [Elusimicrobiota bacterium]|nr:amidase family protein [Elusimicrobiota bacterium]
MTLKETAEKISAGKLSASENLADCLSNIDSSQKELNSFITLYKDRAREKAGKIDGTGSDLPLAGVPFAIKDNMMLEGTRITCGSKILKGYISPYTATAVKKLEEAGAVIIGKTNMDEFAMGSSGETSAYGATKNPVDKDKIPGGSSSGSAAAVSAGQVPGSLGSDTGGSIRQPAAMCGVVGLKPTYGLVSRYGLVAFASSLDQIGPFAGNVEDAAIILNVIAGYDPKDSTSLDVDKKDYTEKLNDGVKGMVFGIPEEYMGEGLSDPIRERVEDTLKELQKRGAKVKTLS